MLKGGKCLNCRPPAVEGPRKGHVNSRLRKLNADGGLDELIISFASAPIALNILVERVKPEAEKKLNKTFTPAGYKILYEVVYKAGPGPCRAKCS
jgi:hypothetical protein